VTTLVTSTLTLLESGTRIRWNQLRRSSWRYILGWTVFIAFMAGLAMTFALAINVSVRLALRTGSVPDLTAVPGGLLVGVWFFTFVTGFGVALSALYLANDLELLMVAPVPIHAVFSAKLFQASLPTYLFVALPVLPSLWAYGLAQRYNPLYFLGVLAVLALLPALPVGLAALAVMAVVRVVPARRVAEILGLVAAVTSVAFSLWGQGASAGTFRGFQPASITRNITHLDIPFTPPSLAGHGLVALGSGDWEGAARGLGAFAALSIAGFVVALDASASLYYSGWAKMRSGSGRGRRSRPTAAPSPLAAWMAHPIPAIVLRDWLIIPRDLSNIVQVLAPLAFSVFWAWQLLRLPARLATDSTLAPLVPTMTTLATAMVTGLVFTRFALTGINREGKAAWLLRAAPVSPWQWLWAKFLVAYLPFVGLGLALTLGLGVAMGASSADIAQSALTLILVGAGIMGLAVGIGGAAVRFDWSNPHQMVGYAPSIIALAAYTVYGIAIIALLGAARLAASLWLPVAGFAWAGSIALAVALTMGAVVLPLWVAAERLRNLE